MRAFIARTSAALCVTAFLVSCDREPPMAPPEQPLAHAVTAAAALAMNGLTTVANSPGRIDLTWADDSRNETGFEVYRATTGAGGSFIKVSTTGADVTTYSDTGLPIETEQCYMVRAFRTSGRKTTFADFSNPSCARVVGPPLAPGSIGATPGSSSRIDIIWTDASTSEDGFRLERSATTSGPWEALTVLPTNSTSFQDTGRPSEQNACYRVIAFNAYGDSDPSPLDCTSPPAAPTGLTATVIAAGVIEVRWTDNSVVEDAYLVEHSTDGVRFVPWAAVPANSGGYIDAAATANVTHWYRVRAMREGGFSDPSSSGSAVFVSDAVEICFNGTDDDFDGLVDEDCTCDHEGCGVE